MTERGLPPEGAPACPFEAFEDDRDGRSTAPEAGARCFFHRSFDVRRILKTKVLVGAARFELTTPCAQGIGMGEFADSDPPIKELAPIVYIT